MNAIAVPTLPLAVFFMENYHRPPWHRCRGKTLLKILGECSEGNKCVDCAFKKRCVEEYDALVGCDVIVNWKETDRHVTRYYK
jgi:hypothetical protein